MQVFTRRLRSPTAPTAAALKSAVKSELEPLWVGGRRVRCWSVTSDHEELRILPYMDDFILFAPTRAKALQARARVQAVLDHLGLSRHPSKGQWDPTQRLDHLGICISLEKIVMFFVPVGRLEKIRKMAHALICRAKRNRRLLPAGAIAGFTGLVQSVYLAIPVAKLYLRSLHDMLKTKTSLASNVRASAQALRDLEWWSTLESKWNGREIYRSPVNAHLHTHVFLKMQLKNWPRWL
jgi:hypothetical protein